MKKNILDARLCGNNKKRSGFTLIELLVVIAIIGILATIAIVALQDARAKSRDAKRVADVKEIQTALQAFYSSKMHYPNATEFVSNSSFGSYMSKIPTPPTIADGDCSSTDAYSYVPSSDGASYLISYCVGGPVGKIARGTHCATPNSLDDDVACKGEQAPICVDDEGGIITYDGDYTIHTFATSGTYTANCVHDVAVLVVAGGGGGDAGTSAINFGNGGAGGSVVYVPSQSVTVQSYPVTVGAGGVAGGSGTGGKGGDSAFISVTAGGGKGSAANTKKGGDNDNYIGGTGVGGFYNGGGGAGGGGNGGNRDGGVGYSTEPGASISGIHINYAGGGSSAGGLNVDGGGYGMINSAKYSEAGTDGLGGGGGGGYADWGNLGGRGGSGIVIIRYLSTSHH